MSKSNLDFNIQTMIKGFWVNEAGKPKGRTITETRLDIGTGIVFSISSQYNEG